MFEKNQFKIKVTFFLTSCIFLTGCIENKDNSLIHTLSFFNDFSGLTTLIVLLAVITSFVFPRFSNYLDSSQKNNSNSFENLENIQKLEKEVKELKEFKLASTIQITDKEKTDILKRLNSQFEDTITESYIQKLETKLKLKNIEDLTQKSLDRLNNEVLSLGRRGTVNLFLGIALSIFGVLYLITTISNSVSYTEYEKLISYYVPRTLFVIFIEIFSFFFLNLYKKSLEEIKFFQNEITNLEAKYLALTIAEQSGNFKLISSALDQLLKTERNFVLKKDETTIELEKNKIEAQSSNNTVQALKDIINFKR